MSSPGSKLNEWSAENLERAAKYMRELDASVNAKSAIELARREQDVELAREAAKSKQYEVERSQAASHMERVRAEEQRKTIDHKSQREKALVDYRLQGQRKLAEEEDVIVRRREDDSRRRSIEDERLKAEIRRRAEESLQAERRRSEEHRAQLERASMAARVAAETEGRIREQRENEAVHARAALARLGEERRTRLESIAAYFAHAGAGADSFLSDPRKMAAAALAVGGVFLGIWGTREGVRVLGRFAERRLGTPPLVRETSRMSSRAGIARRLLEALGARPAEGSSLSDVVLRAGVAERVARLAASVRSTRAHGAPFRNVLLYGPPGTGKTMVAKRLAATSGLDYAIMSGGDVGPLGRDAVTELHRLFDWAASSRRGLLLFIDEADAFLASRARAGMSEEQRNALNALLYRTGESSRNFMLVLATNRPGDLDAAVADRVDEAMVFERPDAAARGALVRQYFLRHILEAGREARWGPWGLFARASARIAVEPDIDEACLEALAGRLEGFSGREIAKLFICVAGDVYGRSEARLTRAILDEVVAAKVAEHEAKGRFGEAEFDFVAPQRLGAARRRLPEAAEGAEAAEAAAQEPRAAAVAAAAPPALPFSFAAQHAAPEMQLR